MGLGGAQPEGQLGNFHALLVDVNAIEVVLQDAVFHILELDGISFRQKLRSVQETFWGRASCREPRVTIGFCLSKVRTSSSVFFPKNGAF